MTVQAPEPLAQPGALPAAAVPRPRPRSRLKTWLRRRDLDLWIPGVVLGALLIGCLLLPLTGGEAGPPAPAAAPAVLARARPRHRHDRPRRHVAHPVRRPDLDRGRPRRQPHRRRGLPGP